MGSPVVARGRPSRFEDLPLVSEAHVVAASKHTGRIALYCTAERWVRAFLVGIEGFHARREAEGVTMASCTLTRPSANPPAHGAPARSFNRPHTALKC